MDEPLSKGWVGCGSHSLTARSMGTSSLRVLGTANTSNTSGEANGLCPGFGSCLEKWPRGIAPSQPSEPSSHGSWKDGCGYFLFLFLVIKNNLNVSDLKAQIGSENIHKRVSESCSK